MMLINQSWHDFLLSEKLTENLVYGYAEQDIVYRRIESEKSYIKMRAKKYVDIKDNIAMITLHNVKRTYRSVMEMKRELQKNESDKKKHSKGLTIDKLNALSYEIADISWMIWRGRVSGGLQGEEIPLCAQVVGLADAYDALVSPRPYKRKLTHGEALQMILNGECGSFSQPLLHCFLEAAMQKEWIKKADSWEIGKYILRRNLCEEKKDMAKMDSLDTFIGFVYE